MTPAERRLLRVLIVGAILVSGWLTHRGVWLIW